MVLESRQSLNMTSHLQHYIPEHLQVLFNKIELEHYEELYETEADGTASLQHTLNEVLEAFHSSDRTVNHLRYLWMTLILTIAVQPTLEYYQPSNSLPENTINLLTISLRNNINGRMNIPKTVIENLINILFKESNFYSQKEVASSQIISEATDVFYQGIRVINYEQAVKGILEILYDCLEGYAIFPGSYGRRYLFDWWLLDVVPASWNLIPPENFYVVETLQNKEEIQFRQNSLIEKISNELSFSLIEELQLINQESRGLQTMTDIGTIIVSTPGICGGRPRIAGHRITVHNIAIDFNAGMKPEEIVAEKPQLTLAQIYAALAYYYCNKEAIDAEIAAEVEYFNNLEAEYQAKL
jgi:uncharacterized protein (DUF433 family)